MELVVRLNSRLPLGHFDLHPEHGLLAMSTGIILGTADIDREIFEHLLFANWAALDSRFPAITAVLSGTVCPKDASERLRDTEEPEDTSEPVEIKPQRRNHGPFGGRLGRIPGISDN